MIFIFGCRERICSSNHARASSSPSCWHFRVARSVSLRRPVTHRTITRKVQPYGDRYHHVANLRRPDDLDDQLLGWLTEAYLDSPPGSA